jgi:hypothetical protein
VVHYTLDIRRFPPEKLTLVDAKGRGVPFQIETLPRVDASRIQAASGAEPSDLGLRGTGVGPLSLFQVREELFQRLQTTGGRPSLSGTSRRTKIPLSDRQWEELEDIAKDVASPGFSPSPGQIASVLISLSLRSLHASERAGEGAA